MKTATIAAALLFVAATALDAEDAPKCTWGELSLIDDITRMNRESPGCSHFKDYPDSALTTHPLFLVCHVEACVAQIKSTVDKYPSCTAMGDNVKQAITVGINECAKALTPTPTTQSPSSSSTSPTLRTPSPSLSPSDSSSSTGIVPVGKTDSSAMPSALMTALAAPLLAFVVVAMQM